VLERAALALVALACVVLVACGGGADDRLDVLEVEQLASFVAPGGTIESQPESNEGEIARVFRYDDSAAARAGGQAAIDAARASGWELTYEAGEPGDPRTTARTTGTKTASATPATPRRSAGSDTSQE
jgi:hypothetical protein